MSIHWIYVHIRLKGKKMKFGFLVTQFGSRGNIGYQVSPQKKKAWESRDFRERTSYHVYSLISDS